jgi:CBS domain containing-hemolysin-like protein
VGVVLLLFSAIASASESAFLSVTGDQLEKLRKSAKEQTVVALLDQRPVFFATIKLFSAIARIGLATVITLIFFTESPTILSVGLAIVYVAFATALCIEAIPKIYAKKSALPFARLTSGVWSILVLICKPIVIHFIDLKSVVNNEHDEQGTVSDELNDALVQATEKEVTYSDEYR